MAFVILRDLKGHLRNHDASLRPFQCSECQKTFTNKQGLSDHIREVHSKFILPCHICGKFFRGKKLLNIHIKSHDSQYTCGIKREHRVFVLICKSLFISIC